MKKALCILLVAVLLSACIPALAAGKLAVETETFWVVDNYSVYSYAYARVKNVGDKPIKVNAGVLEVYDGEGNPITSSDYLNAYANYLEAGEYTYCRIYSEVEKGKAALVDDYALTITGKSDRSYKNIRLPVTCEYVPNVKNGYSTYNYLYATVENNQTEPIYNIAVVAALLDADGKVLYIDDSSAYSMAIMPGSSVRFRMDVPSSFTEYFKAHDVTPASADAIAFIKVEND